MRIISKSRLREFWSRPGRADAQEPLLSWYDIVDDAVWKNPTEVKAVFGANVDFVKVASDNTVAVFDIGGNKYRLIAAIHYDYPPVFVLRVMTHREYDRQTWKKEL